MIVLYTDGAAQGNPGPGGYAGVLMYKDKRKEYCGAYVCTTNNRMELLAVIVGLELLKGKGRQVKVYTDSRYVVDAVRKGWLWGWESSGFKKRKNSDLWQRFLQVFRMHQVTLTWVKGHGENVWNIRCDELAVRARQEGPWEVDKGYGKGLSSSEGEFFSKITKNE